MVDGDEGGEDGGEDGLRIPPPGEKSWINLTPKTKIVVVAALCFANRPLLLGHPLFQALCLIICSEILPYSIKTAVSDAVFSKVSPLAIFAGNKIGEKYHAIFLWKRSKLEKIWTRGGAGGPKGVVPRGYSTRPRGPP